LPSIHSFILHSFITYATNKRKSYLLLVAIIHACNKKKKKKKEEEEEEEEDEKEVSLAGWLAGWHSNLLSAKVHKNLH
jgi:hypothetical protein